MKKIFLDADVIFDFLFAREPFHKEIIEIMNLVDLKKLTACISSLTLSHAYYFLRRKVGSEKAHGGIEDLYDMLDILSVDDNTIQSALKSGFNDFEDAIQYCSALADGSVEAIVTRNLKHFKHSQISVITPETALNLII